MYVCPHSEKLLQWLLKYIMYIYIYIFKQERNIKLIQHRFMYKLSSKGMLKSHGNNWFLKVWNGTHRFWGKDKKFYFMYTTNIFTTQTLCVFFSGTTDADFATDYSKLWIIEFWPKYNKSVVKFTMICCRQGWELNRRLPQTYYCWTRALWTA